MQRTHGVYKQKNQPIKQAQVETIHAVVITVWLERATGSWHNVPNSSRSRTPNQISALHEQATCILLLSLRSYSILFHSFFPT